MKVYTLKIHPHANLELRAAKDWYNTQKEGLGDDFLFQVEKILLQITQNPKQFGKIRKDIRKVVLKRFPYSIVFSIVGNTIELYSFFHHSRNPKIWNERTK